MKQHFSMTVAQKLIYSKLQVIFFTTHTYEENDDENSDKPVREDNTESNTNSDSKHEHRLEQKSQIIV